MASWTPATAGTGFELSPTLTALESFKNSMVVVSNLKRAGGQAEMHAAAASGWLSGAVPKRTEAEDLACGTSIDQVLAQADRTVVAVSVARVRHRGLHRLRRRLHAGLQLRLSRRDRLGVADARRCRWRSTRACAFERLFGDGGSDAQRRSNLREDRSILDGILNDMRALQTQARRARSRARGHLPAGRARDRAAHPAQRGAAARRRHARQAARHPGLVRGPHAR